MSDKDDLISRKEALKICRRYWHPTYNPIMEEIEKLPPAQPEIVRCKDCKWKQGSECVRFAEVRPFPDDFCSRAERRTDG